MAVEDPWKARRALRAARRTRRRRLIFAAAGLVVLAGAGLGTLVARDLFTARRLLTEARTELAGIASDPGALAAAGRRDEARARTAVAEKRAKAAHDRLRRSIPLRVAAAIPGVGHQRSGLLRLAADAEVAAAAGHRLLTAATEVAGHARLQGGRIPLAGLRTLEEETGAAARALRPLQRGRRGLLGPLGDARVEFDGLVADAGRRLEQASEGLRLARSIVGDGASRRWLVAGMNNAEMRDQGMVLSYAVLSFDGGQVDVVAHGPIDDLALAEPVSVKMPPGTAAMFGGLLPTMQWRSVNATADWPWSAEVMAAMYAQATGRTVDGVVGLDVVALAAVLQVVGPVEVGGGLGRLSAANARQRLLWEQYKGLPPGSDQQARREQVAAVADAVVDRLRTATVEPVALGRALGEAARGGHLRLWSSRADEEGSIRHLGLGGPPGGTAPERTFHVAVQDATGTKVDWFVRVGVTMDVRITPAASAVVRTTVTVRNEAPAGAGPSYALGPNTEATDRPGQYVGRVYLWAPPGATHPDATPDAGLLVAQKPVSVAPGDEASVVFETVLPGAARAGTFGLRLVPQPRAVPADLDVAIVDDRGERRRSHAEPWDRTRDLSWSLR